MSVQTAVKPDFAAAKRGFDEDGFIILRGYFTPAETKELADRLDNYVTKIVPTVPPEDAFYEIKGKPESLKQLQRMGKHDPYFLDIESNPKLVDLGKVLLGDELQSRGALAQGAEWFNKPARIGSPTPPHQDGFYFALEPNEALTFWIPQDVVDESNGCIRYVAGSHKLGLRPHGRTTTLGFSLGITDYGPADKALEKLVIVKPGDVVVHHSMTIHSAGANTSERSRRALGVVYYAARAKQNRTWVEEHQKNLMKDLARRGEDMTWIAGTDRGKAVADKGISG